MPLYDVVWRIDIDSDDPIDAALEAANIQRDPTSIATVFEVRDPRTKESWVIDTHTENGPQVIGNTK